MKIGILWIKSGFWGGPSVAGHQISVKLHPAAKSY